MLFVESVFVFLIESVLNIAVNLLPDFKSWKVLN